MNVHKTIFRIAVIVVVIAGVMLIAASAYADRRPWLFADGDVPDVIGLGNGYSLVRVVSLRRGYHIDSVSEDAVSWTAKNGNGSFAFDGSGNFSLISEIPEDMPETWITHRVIADGSDGRFVYEQCCEAGGITLITGDKLGVIDAESGRSVYLFPSDKGGSWSLDDPRVYGEFLAVRIFWCDHVYRLSEDRGERDG